MVDRIWDWCIVYVGGACLLCGAAIVLYVLREVTCH